MQPHPLPGDQPLVVQAAPGALSAFGGTPGLNPAYVGMISVRPEPEARPDASRNDTGRQATQQARVPPQPVVQLQQQHGGHSMRQGKPMVSHSTVEKQRRDRINSLIDELRDLVPPPSHQEQRSEGGEGSMGGGVDGGKRPKHQVLSDTISLVKELQNKLAVSEERAAALQRHEDTCPFHGLEEHAVADKRAAQPGSEPPQQQAMEATGGCSGTTSASVSAAALSDAAAMSVDSQEGVEIEQGAGCLFVKVCCRDRHGLLADIVRTLKAVPVEISSAAITTRGNYVHDVFQITPPPGQVAAPVEEVRDAVLAVMAGAATAEKKRRMESL